MNPVNPVDRAAPDRAAPDRAYLDHAATTPVRASALAAFAEAAGLGANPASLHAAGRRAKLVLEEARERIAAAVGAQPSEVVLTSGGTEADNLALQGLYRARRAQDPARTRIVLTGIEHHAVLDAVAWLAAHEGAEPVLVGVEGEGRVDLQAWEATLSADPDAVALATLMWANNEVGTVQPVAEAAALAAGHGVPFHTDAVQAVGAVPVDFAASGASTLALSGHKLGAPVGIGALLVRRDVPLEPVAHGGGQERRLRAGTVPVALAAALAAAVEEAVREQPAEAARLGALRDRVLDAVDSLGGLDVTGARDVDPATGERLPVGTRRLPGNIHVTVPETSADALLFRMDMAGLDTSSGSACTAGVAEPSHVVEAMGLGGAARSTQRFTLGHTTTPDDVERLIAVLRGL